MTSRECETCIKRKTVYCPNSIECMATDDKPYYQNRIMLLEENQELKKQLEVSNELVAQGTLTEMKLRNEFNRRRKEYQDTYKDVRIEIKEYKTQQKEFINYLEDNWNTTQDIWYIKILQKYKEIVNGTERN